jgi:hypothetical protein
MIQLALSGIATTPYTIILFSHPPILLNKFLKNSISYLWHTIYYLELFGTYLEEKTPTLIHPHLGSQWLNEVNTLEFWNDNQPEKYPNGGFRGIASKLLGGTISGLWKWIEAARLTK